jgi:hypothetical protein
MGLAVVSTAFGLRGYGALAGAVVSAERAATVDALRARPRGWAAGTGTPPPALGDFAWGALGARLADALAARRSGRGTTFPSGTAHVAGASPQKATA